MTQYYPSEPWNYEYEIARGTPSVTSVLRNVNQRKAHENKGKRQQAPPARESVNGNPTGSRPQYAFHRRPDKHRKPNNGSTERYPHYAKDSHLDSRRDKDRAWCQRTVSAEHYTTLAQGRSDYHNRQERGGGPHGHQRPTSCNRTGVSGQEKKLNPANEHVGGPQKKKTSFPPRELAKHPGTNSAGGSKSHRKVKEQSRSPQTILHIQHQPKQQTPKRTPSPPQPTTSRKRSWKHAIRALTPDSEDESDYGETYTGRSQDHQADCEYVKDDTPSTAFNNNDSDHPRHEDPDSVHYNPKSVQSCSSVCSYVNSSETDTGSSLCGSDLEDNIPEDCLSYRPQPVQRQLSPLPVSPAAPRKVRRVDHSQPQPQSQDESGDNVSQDRSRATGKGVNPGNPQARSVCAKKPSDHGGSHAKIPKNTLSSATGSPKNKKKSAEQQIPKSKTVTVKASSPCTPKNKRKPASTPPLQNPDKDKPVKLKNKPSSTRAKPVRTKKVNATTKAESAVAGPQHRESTNGEDHIHAKHAEAAEEEHPNSALLQMCNDLKDIPVPCVNQIANAADIETDQACASLYSSKYAWSHISHAEVEAWDEKLVNPSYTIDPPLREITTEDTYQVCTTHQYEERRPRNGYSPIEHAVVLDDTKSKTTPPHLDSLCEESVVDFTMFLNSVLLIPSATLNDNCQHTKPEQHTSPQAASQQQSLHVSGDTLSLDVQM